MHMISALSNSTNYNCFKKTETLTISPIFVENLIMEHNMFDNVRFEKEKAMARFNSFRRIAKILKILEAVMVFGLISWSSARLPSVLRVLGGYIVEFSACLFNHHVVFIIGNTIIVSLFMLCRQNDDENLHKGEDLYEEYVKHSDQVTHQHKPTLPPVEEEEKVMVVKEDIKVVPQCDDVAEAIERATRQIKRFERTQSEKLKREIAVRRGAELRRSSTENCREMVKSGERKSTSKIEALSNEEFRRTVDAFIDQHWSTRRTIMN